MSHHSEPSDTLFIVRSESVSIISEPALKHAVATQSKHTSDGMSRCYRFYLIYEITKLWQHFIFKVLWNRDETLSRTGDFDKSEPVSCRQVAHILKGISETCTLLKPQVASEKLPEYCSIGQKRPSLGPPLGWLAKGKNVAPPETRFSTTQQH